MVLRNLRHSLCAVEKKVGPRFLLLSETFPNLAVITKETRVINKLEGDVNDLFEAVRNVAGGNVVNTIFALVEKGFNWLVDIVRIVKNSVVSLKICGGDVGVGGIQVIQDGACGCGAVSDVLASEGYNEHFVNGRENILSNNLISAIILVEE